MLIEYIERLRERPHGARRRVALVTAGVSTAVVAMLWAISLPSTFGSLAIRLEDLSASVGATGLGDAVKENNQGLQQMINLQETFGGSVPPQAEENVPADYQEYSNDAVLGPSPATEQSGRGAVIIATSSSERR